MAAFQWRTRQEEEARGGRSTYKAGATLMMSENSFETASGTGGAGERGVALIIVIICSMLMILLGLSLTWSTMTSFSTSMESEAAEQSMNIADAGYSLAKESLRGADLTALLAAATTVDRYLTYPVPTGPTELAYFSRNPMSTAEAINVDFANPPSSLATRTVNGLVTPPTGTVIGSGRYFAKLTDNDDGDSDLLADVDGSIILRVMGIHRGSVSQINSYGTPVHNSVTTIEALLRRDESLDFGSPFTVYGPSVSSVLTTNPLMQGYSFDGRPHDQDGNLLPGTAGPGMSVVWDDPPPGGSDASAPLTELCTESSTHSPGALTDTDINGDPGDCTGPPPPPPALLPSIQDTTNDFRNGGPQATNFFDPQWMGDFADNVSSIASNPLPGGTINGSNTWGTRGSPEITVVEGDLTVGLGADVSGAGLLIVKGDVNLIGGLNFEGLVMVLGGSFSSSPLPCPPGCPANPVQVIGGVFQANLIESPPGSYSYGANSVRIAGDSDFLFSAEATQNAFGMLPMRVDAWKQLARELEPY